MEKRRADNGVVTIDDRFLLLALDRLYREAMQMFERESLLDAARTLARTLDVAPLDVPVEGYYATDPALSEYFRLIRALQRLPASHEVAVATLPEFRQLWSVFNSPIYGRPKRSGLLPQGSDALTEALQAVAPEWTIATVLPAARRAAIQTDDYSLVGLAARIEDAVVLTAVRESVVLYAQVVFLGRLPRTPAFEWRVDPVLAEQANRFVEAFNAFASTTLPAVKPENAPVFCVTKLGFAHVAGRCARLGIDPSSLPVRHYHWAICLANDSALRVQEFWANEVWTTERYLAERTKWGRCLES